MLETVIISGCLLGENCRYDGKSQINKMVLNLSYKYLVKSICPEILGGLPKPRPACEISYGDGADVLDGLSRVIQETGYKDVTESFISGAGRVLKAIEGSEIKFAIMKERSPSCGVKWIYRQGQLVKGAGVTTAALLKSGIRVFSEENILEVENDRSAAGFSFDGYLLAGGITVFSESE